MTALQFRSWGAGWLMGALFSAAIVPASAWAYTMEQEQACTGDAFRLCSSEIPSISRITACMAQHRSQLSPACRAQFTAGPGQVASDEGPDSAPVVTHRRARAHRYKRPSRMADD